MKTTKLKKVNFEKNRTIYFQIGLIISLAAVLTAFEWTSSTSNNRDDLMNAGTFIDEEMTAITIQKKKQPVKPKPVVMPITLVDNNTKIDGDIEISVEVKEDTYNQPDIIFEKPPEKEAEDDSVYIFVQQYPSFPGGMEAFFRYLRGNLKYPGSANEIGIKGTVHVSFTVWKDGTIRNVLIERGIGGGCDEATVRVIQNMPRWNPGIQHSQPVSVRMTLPVKFTLQ